MSEKSIQTELSDIIGQMTSQAQSMTPTNEPTAPPTPEPAQAEPAVTPPNVAEPVVAAPAASPVAPTEKKIDVDAVVESWDDPLPAASSTPPASAAPAVTPQAPAVTVPSLELQEIAKVLKKETLTSKDEALRELESRLKQAEAISALPDPVKKAVEIAALGGNYLEYLGVSQIDWTKEDPITLYENYVEDQFVDSTGRVDIERVDKFLDKLDDDEKEFRGRELQKQYTAYQAQQKANIENQARMERAAFEGSVRKAIESTDNIAGFKLTPSHKEELYSFIVSGQDVKQPDVNTRLFNAFITKYWSKIDSFRKQQVRNSTMKTVLDEVTVPQITPVGTPGGVQTGSSDFSLDTYIKNLQVARK